MNNLITETINPREAVLFSCGGVNEVARQFAEMLIYCILTLANIRNTLLSQNFVIFTHI